MAKRRKVHSLTGRITFPLVHAAWRRVRRNRGAAGIDKVSVKMFEANLDENLQALMRDLKNGSLEPKPLRRVYIPKDAKRTKFRPLLSLAQPMNGGLPTEARIFRPRPESPDH